MNVEKTKSYAVFWYNEDIDEKWRRYGRWHCRIEEALAELVMIRQFARFKHTKIVQKTETYRDVKGGKT